MLIYGDYKGKPGWENAVLTGSQGRADVGIVGCAEAGKKGYGINALAPTGYRLTTPPRVAVPAEPEFADVGQLKLPFAFGYTVDRQGTPVSERPVFTDCESFRISSGWGELASDGSLWTMTFEIGSGFSLMSLRFLVL